MMFRIIIWVFISVMLTIITGELPKTCFSHRCSCVVNSTDISSQPFNVDDLDFKPIILATALGTVTSCLVLTTMGVWWKWKTSSVTDSSSLDSTSDKQGSNQNSRSISPSASSNGSWATPRTKTAPGFRDWPEMTDSIG